MADADRPFLQSELIGDTAGMPVQAYRGLAAGQVDDLDVPPRYLADACPQCLGYGFFSCKEAAQHVIAITSLRDFPLCKHSGDEAPADFRLDFLQACNLDGVDSAAQDHGNTSRSGDGNAQPLWVKILPAGLEDILCADCLDLLGVLSEIVQSEPKMFHIHQ